MLEAQDPSVAREVVAHNHGVITTPDRRDVFLSTEIQKRLSSLRLACVDVDEGLAFAETLAH